MEEAEDEMFALGTTGNMISSVNMIRSWLFVYQGGLFLLMKTSSANAVEYLGNA